MVFGYVIVLATILINDYAVMDHNLCSNIGSFLVDDLCVYIDTKYIEDRGSQDTKQNKIGEALQILHYTNATSLHKQIQM